jgi:hypothetical protein
MFPNNIEFFGRERYSERLQDAEHIRLIKLAQPQMFNYQETTRKFATWLGGQMIGLGSKLQGYGTLLLSKTAPVDITHVQVR